MGQVLSGLEDTTVKRTDGIPAFMEFRVRWGWEIVANGWTSLITVKYH